MTVVAALCWISVGLIVYSYLVYPLLLAIVSRGKGGETAQVCCSAVVDWPQVSLVIAAYREEKVIAERLQNALAMDYPADKVEILIGVDGDLDSTGTIVASFDDPRVRLLQYPERRGKASVLNDSIPQANGDIVLLSDANTFWDTDAIKQLVRHFGDERVGGVCGRLILTDGETGKNVDGYYWRYENWVKNKEGEIGALLGANGAIYAIRKALYEPIPPHTIVDDFLIGMRIHRSRKKFLYDKTAVAREETAPSIHDEFRRRTRIGAGNFQSLCWLSRLLLPDFGTVSWAFWSHKVLRWLCPLLMVVAFATSAVLADQPVYRGLMIAQGLFYAAAIVGHSLPLSGKLGSVGRLAWMFVMMNVALGIGFFRWVFRTQKATWKRTERTQEGPFALSAPAK